MKFTEEQMTLLKKKLKVKAGCSNCGEVNGLNIDPHEYQLNSRKRDGLSISEPERFTPVVVTSCPDCGYVKLFNLITLGIVND